MNVDAKITHVTSSTVGLRVTFKPLIPSTVSHLLHFTDIISQSFPLHNSLCLQFRDVRSFISPHAVFLTYTFLVQYCGILCYLNLLFNCFTSWCKCYVLTACSFTGNFTYRCMFLFNSFSLSLYCMV